MSKGKIIITVVIIAILILWAAGSILTTAPTQNPTPQATGNEPAAAPTAPPAAGTNPPSAAAPTTPAAGTTPPAAGTTPPAAQAATVTYSNSGFSPSVITIKAGTTVTFKNDSSNPMWVASDPHPQHTIYPEFDAKRTYAPGESYSFTFTRVGTWGYHNHRVPTDTGKVTVQ